MNLEVAHSISHGAIPLPSCLGYGHLNDLVTRLVTPIELEEIKVTDGLAVGSITTSPTLLQGIRD